jgi:small subunit ribosomal protein S3Ae
MAVKKQWYEIVSPKMFGEKVVGETLSVDPKFLMGRILNISFANISQDFSKFFIKMEFQVEKVEGQKAFTKFIGYEIMRERLFRMIRRRSKKVDTVQDTETKDGINFRIKSIFILKGNATTSARNAARVKAKEVIAATAKVNTLEKLVNMMITGELQKKIRQECRKIAPVGSVEIRRAEIIQERTIEEKIVA